MDENNERNEIKMPDFKKVLKKSKKLKVEFSESYQKFQGNIPAFLGILLCAFAIMCFAAFTIFFINVKGPEKVLVPNVEGKKLEDALLEMQVKELYPKISLRYSETPGDEGTILDQSPKAGAIVKGYSRVSLVVSRGVIVDKVDDYSGMNIEDLRMKLQTLFAGQKPLIVLLEPEYKPDASDAGTILEQDPPAGTHISEPVKVQLVVSRGPNYENTKAPYLIGQAVNDLLQTMARSKLVFDIKSHKATDGEVPGTVVDQQAFDDEFIRNYTRISLEMALPQGVYNENIFGIYKEKVADYPYPVPMKLEAYPPEGNSYTILSFNHPGGNVTVPYAVPKGTTLELSVVNKVISRKTVN
ncbi:MAG: PASTA domain-containing protein [Treponema sp.]|nr:PASTA domain-containing protein [Treponema sp.]